VPNSIFDAEHNLKAHAQQVLDVLKARPRLPSSPPSPVPPESLRPCSRRLKAPATSCMAASRPTRRSQDQALGVSQRLLKEQGAVNADVVKQLAAGALERSPATMAIAISGVLAHNPMKRGSSVGLVYFCALAKDKPPTVVKEQFGEQSHGQLLGDALHRAFDLIEGSVSPPARKHA
jgi:Competence-damaged protein